MESQKPKIALYVKRPFGDKLNATMDFIKENWKPMLKFCTYLILPLCLIQAISMNGIMGGAMGIAAAKEAGTNSLAAIGMGKLRTDVSLLSGRFYIADFYYLRTDADL